MSFSSGSLRNCDELLATFGVSILLQQLMNQMFGADIRRPPPHGLGTWSFSDGIVTIDQIKALAALAALALSVMLVLFLKRSRLGQAIRATAQKARAARIMGIDTGRVYAATYALNAAVCGAAGALVAMVWAIEPYLGLIFTIRSFMIVIVAGLRNLAGVVAAGVGLGAVENFAGFTLGTEFQVAFVFGLLVVILVGRSALLARQRRPRVSIKSPLPGPAVPDAYIFIYWACRMAAASAWPRAASALARARAWS